MTTLWGALCEVVGTTLTIGFLLALIAGPPEMLARHRKAKQRRMMRERREARAQAWWDAL